MSQSNRKFQFLTPLSILACLVACFYIFKSNPRLMTEETLASQHIHSKDKDRSPIPLPESQKPRSKNGFEASNMDKQNRTRESILNQKWRWERRFTLVSQRDYAIGVDLAKPPMISRDESGFYLTSGSKLVATMKDGKFLWSFELKDREFIQPPTLSRKYVFVTTKNGDIYEIEKETGHLVWILPTHMEALQPMMVIEKELFFFGLARPTRASPRESTHLVKINSKNGNILWESAPLSSPPSSLAALDLTRRLLIVGTQEGQVLALSLKKGEILWTAYTRGAIKGAPMLYEDHVFVANVEAEAFAFNIETGERLWTYELSSGTNESFTRIPGTKWITVSTHRGYLHTVNRKTGEGKWKYNLRNQFSSYPSYSMRFRNQEIEELGLKWRYQGWVVWTPCNDRYICFLAPESGRLLQRVPLNGVIAGQVFFEKNGFFANLKKSEKSTELSDYLGITHFIDSARFRRLQKRLSTQAQTTTREN